MFLEIISGAIGSGKSRYMLDEISKHGGKNIIVVPEQFSYAAEKTVVERCGGAGLNNIEVITLSRLVLRCIDEKRDRYLTPAGKMMLICTAVKSLPKESLFGSSAKKPGFIDSAAQIISEFTEYMITPEILKAKADEAQNPLLREKLSATADMFEAYLKLSGADFLDSEEDISRLADVVLEKRLFDGCDFWFDEFSVFLPQHYKFMKALLNSGCNVHAAISADSCGRELYDVNRSIIYRLKKLAEENGAGICEHFTDDRCRKLKSSEMNFLFEHLEDAVSPDFEPMEKKTEDISVFVSKDLYAEVVHTALSIRKLIMEEGYRYKDIAVVCADMGAYSHIFEAVFNDFSIPYFADNAISASDHPISTLILEVFDIMVQNWSYASVLRYLRTGYIYKKEPDGIFPIDPDGVDMLENYMLKYGIRGKSTWLDDEKWNNAQKGLFEGVLGEEREIFSKEELEKINQTRLDIITPFKKLYESLSGRRSVREFAKALFEFLGDIHLYEAIVQKSKELDGAGFRNEAEQIRIIWNIIVETLNQSVVVMGNKKIKREDFADLLKVGLCAQDIAIIPSGLDRVAISSVERSRQIDAKVMFITGAVFGAIPKENTSDGILTDSDRLELKSILESDGLDIAADSKKRNSMDKLNFFCTLFGVSDKVFFSYPAQDAEGNIETPSSIISDLYKIFPNMTTGDNIIEENGEDFLYSPRAAFNYMLSNRRKNPIADEIFAWFAKNAPERLNVIKKAGEYKQNAAKITPENAAKLYRDHTQYSVSRLNEYGKCPFAYFVKYGLNAKEQQLWQIQKFDLGSIMHLAVQLYCQKVEAGSADFETLKNNWRALTDEKSAEITAEVMQSIKEKIMRGLTRDENKIRYIIMRMTKIVTKSAESVRKSICAGEYTAIAFEQKFRITVRWDNFAAVVDGKIDRIDLAENPEKKVAELRVADYKTGRKNFSVVSICNRQDMQLIMYAAAAVEMYKSGDIKYAKKDYEPKMRAIMYNHMRDDIFSAESFAAAEKKRDSESRPDGLILLDSKSGGLDISPIRRMDSDIAETKESDIIRVKLKKDGTPDSRSQIATTDAFGKLIDYVKKSVIEIDREIYDGVIKIYPLCEGKSKVCDWCEFEEICLYNDRFDQQNALASTEKEAWDIIERAVKEDE